MYQIWLCHRTSAAQLLLVLLSSYQVIIYFDVPLLLLILYQLDLWLLISACPLLQTPASAFIVTLIQTWAMHAHNILSCAYNSINTLLKNNDHLIAHKSWKWLMRNNKSRPGLMWLYILLVFHSRELWWSNSRPYCQSGYSKRDRYIHSTSNARTSPPRCQHIDTAPLEPQQCWTVCIGWHSRQSAHVEI